MAVVAETTRIPFRNSSLRAIIPHATNTYNPPLQAVYVGGATGDVVLTVRQRSADGVNTNTDITYTGVTAGSTISGVGEITRVIAIGTTATGLVGIE